MITKDVLMRLEWLVRPVRGGKRGGEVVVKHRTASITHSIIILSENPFLPNFMGMGRGEKNEGKR